jgi:glycosyltransferase involved in cell wall biosynthesis
MNSAIDILLSTHNGAAYLPALLESLERQTFRDWQLIVRDDGSTDGTLDIVTAWARRQGHDVEIIADGRGSLGACASFGALLEHSRSRYFALCDQDDVWLPAKLAELLGYMQVAEARRGAATPILAHSDLTVVDSSLQPTHRSFRAHKGFHAAPATLPRLVLQNRVTGCASLGNGALRSAALPVPNGSMMHDWWLAMVAAAFGEIVEHPNSLVLYRQHDENVVGTRSWGPLALVLRASRRPLGVISEGKLHVAQTQARARAFLQRFADRLDPETEALLCAYASLSERGFWTRKAFLFRSGMWTSSPIANIGLLAVI